MNDARERLVRCFQAVFPELSGSDAVRANTSRVAGWDSVATVTLAAVAEEEFEIEFAAEEMERLTSFESVLDAVTLRMGAKVSNRS